MAETPRYEHVLDSDDCVTCPYCLTEHWDDLKHVENDSAFTCGECSRQFRVDVEYSVTYTSLVPVDPAQSPALSSVDPVQDGGE